jgi:glycosyltransferase involved in cell wall biosynthesis
MPSKIIWFLWGNPAFIASSRIHGFAIHNKLIAIGYNSFLAYLPTYIEERIPLSNSNKKSFESLVASGDIVILQKIKDISTVGIIEYFKSLRLRVIFVDCDLPVAVEIGKSSDLVVCASKRLQVKYLECAKQTTYIEDAPEYYSKPSRKNDNQKLKCFWFGYASNEQWNEVVSLQEILKDSRLANWELITISNHPDATLPWNSKSLKKISAEADLVAIPVFNLNDYSSAKSANRLLQSMALSLPVICSPVPSYLDIATNGGGAIVCSTKEEWMEWLIVLQNKKMREDMGLAAYAFAQKFNLNESIYKWVEALDLDNGYKSTSALKQKKTQLQLSRLFYTELTKKNLRYYWRAPFSKDSLSNAFLYLQLKIQSIF